MRNRTPGPCHTGAIVAVAALLLAPAAEPAAGNQTASWPTNGWPRATPAAQGLDPAPLDRLHQEIAAGKFGNIDRLVVVRNGHLVVSERYARDYRSLGRGRDTASHQFNYYHPDWHPYYKGREVHTLQSVTKSVTSILIGIAIRRGEIKSVETPLLSFFDGFNLTKVDPRLRRATLRDLLEMRTGVEWHETDRGFDSTNTTVQLEASKDWIQFTLDQPMDADPGSKWVYNSGGSHLMSGVLKKATGRHAHQYAETHLFGPLGIREYHWKITPTGYPDTEGGLYLEAEQLAKIGYLYLKDGMWDGKRIVPEGWVKASTDERVAKVNQAGYGYGFQWWRVDRRGEPVWAGLGFGGQFLIVIPRHQLVGVINSWNIFGGNVPGVIGPFVEALLASPRA